MRIIAGQFRGRKLVPPSSDATRPVTDRVKQSVFDILVPHIADAIVYDCFAGTGSMGLECLSREATRVTFFESDRSAVERLKRNIDVLGVGGRIAIVSQDVFSWFGKGHPHGMADRNVRPTGRQECPPDRQTGMSAPQAGRPGAPGYAAEKPASLVFLDPPYRYLREKAEELRILARNLVTFHLAPDAVVVFRHDAADSLELPHLVPTDVRSYGGMTVEFLSPDKQAEIG